MSCKRIIVVLLSLILLLSFVACNGDKNRENGTTEHTESPIEDFDYKEWETDGITEFTEYGETYNLKGSVYIKKYLGNESIVVIPEMIEGKAVTSIGQNAFANTSVEKIFISDSVQIIADHAFSGALKLKEVHGGASLTKIGIRAFYQCTNLEIVDISTDSMRVIKNQAFYDCKNMIQLKLGNNIHYIGENAFANCHSLKSLRVPQALNNWGTGAFSNNFSLNEVIFPEGIEEIRGYGFFGNCTSITEMTIPASVKKVFETTFYLPNLAKVYFLGDCPDIHGTDPFSGRKEVVIYYDPQTSGWDTCPLRSTHSLMPIDN